MTKYKKDTQHPRKQMEWMEKNVERLRKKLNHAEGQLRVQEFVVQAFEYNEDLKQKAKDGNSSERPETETGEAESGSSEEAELVTSNN